MIYKFKRQHEDTLKKVLKEIKVTDPNNDLSKLDWDDAEIKIEWKTSTAIAIVNYNKDEDPYLKEFVNGLLSDTGKLIDHIYDSWESNVSNLAINLLNEMAEPNHILEYKITFYRAGKVIREFDVIKQKPRYKS
jgi:hypothetical protein